MNKKEEAIKLIKDKIDGNTYLSYDDIAKITGYHPKYLFKLKKEILNNTIKLEHGNTNKKPHNAMSEEEKEKIRALYRKSSVSIRKFCKFFASYCFEIF